jgi:hypothetical protein
MGKGFNQLWPDFLPKHGSATAKIWLVVRRPQLRQARAPPKAHAHKQFAKRCPGTGTPHTAGQYCTDPPKRIPSLMSGGREDRPGQAKTAGDVCTLVIECGKFWLDSKDREGELNSEQ